MDKTDAPDREKALRARREAKRQYRLQNPQATRDAARKWRLANPEKVREGKARYRTRHADRIAAYNDAHREDRAAARARHKAKHRTDRLGRIAKPRAPRPAPVDKLKALLADQNYAAAHAAVPRSIPKDVRDDIISALALAVLEGKVPRGEIAAQAPIFIRAHYKQFDRYKSFSLDVIIDGEEIGEERTTSSRLSDYQAMLASY